MRIYGKFFKNGTDEVIAAKQISAVPRVGEWIMFRDRDKPMRVSMVIYDLHFSSDDETKVRVLVEDP